MGPSVYSTPVADDEERTVDDLQFWIDCLGAPVLVVDKHSPTIRLANSIASDLFKIEQLAIAGLSLSDVLGNEAEQLLGQVWSSSTIGAVGEPFVIPAVVCEEPRSLMVRVTKLSIEGNPLRLFTIIDAPSNGSVTFAGWQSDMMKILNWFPFGFEIADNADRIQFANAECRRLFGYEQHELESAEDWWRLAYPDPAYREYARTKWETEIQTARTEDREMTPFDLDVTSATVQFRHRTIGQFNMNLFLDVTRERRYERELRELAGTDPLTGAMNRRRFFEEVAEKRCGDLSPAALLMIDVDHFKVVNDTYGHAAGDLVLQEVAQRCRDAIRAKDMLARFGGEEFVVLLPDIARMDAVEVARYLCATIEGHPFTPQLKLRITASIGMSEFLATDTLDSALSRADTALYKAKRLGRNRVELCE